MFKRWAIRKNRKDRLDRLSDAVDNLIEEVESMRTEIDALKEKQTYVNEDGERVPMAQVINEYLYGAKEGDA